MNAGVLTDAVELFHKLRGKDLPQRLRQHLPARHGVGDFHLRIPALDPVLHVERHHAHVDRLHDVLVEVFQALVFCRLLLQRGIELSVLNGNSQVAAQGFQQLDVFAGKEISLNGFTQPQDSDGFLLRPARNVVIQIKPLNGCLRTWALSRYLMGILKE